MATRHTLQRLSRLWRARRFHQGIYHCGGTNTKPYNRYIQHMAYSGPWLVRSGRVYNARPPPPHTLCSLLPRCEA